MRRPILRKAESKAEQGQEEQRERHGGRLVRRMQMHGKRQCEEHRAIAYDEQLNAPNGVEKLLSGETGDDVWWIRFRGNGKRRRGMMMMMMMRTMWSKQPLDGPASISSSSGALYDVDPGILTRNLPLPRRETLSSNVRSEADRGEHWEYGSCLALLKALLVLCLV